MNTATGKMMKRYIRIAAISATACVLAAPARAQDTTASKLIGPPVQKIATASAVSTEPIGSITSVRELADGRVLVNDGARRRLLLMDTTLHTLQVVLDSLTDVANTYGTRSGALLPYRGDSTLFIDPASYAMIVLDPSAKIAKVRSVWKVQDLFYVTNPGNGWPGFDAKGRIVYRVNAQPAPPKVAPPSGVPWFPEQPDSAFIVAVSLDSRKLDTLGSVRIPKQEMRIRQMADGGLSFDQITNPLPGTDDWAVLPDGRVAFVRGRDYRIEYLNADGKWTSSAKLPYDWQRLTDDDKKHVVDSARVVLEKQVSTQWVSGVIRWVNQFNGKYPAKFPIPQGYVVPPGFSKDWLLPSGVTFPANYIYACAPGEQPPAGMPTPTSTQTTMVMGGSAPGQVTTFGGPPGGVPSGGPPPGAMPGGGRTMTVNGGDALSMNNRPGAAPLCLPAPVTVTGGITPPPPTQRVVNLIDPSELPDYKPPILPGAVRADADGNLWIRTVQTKPVPGAGGIYDIVNPAGELVNRLQLPSGYTIVGFGKGKVLYVSMRDASGVHLARVRLK